MIRVSQECGQRWWRVRSWRKRPVFRKLTNKVITGVRIDDFQLDARGTHVRGHITESHIEWYGIAIGPILITKDGCRVCKKETRKIYGFDPAKS